MIATFGHDLVYCISIQRFYPGAYIIYADIMIDEVG